MKSDEKKSFSREECRRKMIEETKAECVFYGLPSVPVAVIVVPLAIGVFFAFANVPLILRLFILLIFLLPVFVLLGLLLWKLWEYVVFYRDRFLIVGDWVTQKRTRMGRHGSTQYLLYFSNCRKFRVSEAYFKQTSCGDAVWLVIVSQRIGVPKMIFAVKEYELLGKDV